MQKTKAPDKTPITNLVWNSWVSQGVWLENSSEKRELEA